METYAPYLVAIVITLFFVLRYLSQMKKKSARARESAKKGQLFSEGPRGMHPHIDTSNCIGCGGCTEVCPEGDVLAMLGGQAVIVNGHKCIGHSLCAEACPVGAITMVMASPSMGADLPYLNGYPLRLVVPGHYGTYWVKHLSEITVLDQVFEGFWMKTAYRIPANA